MSIVSHLPPKTSILGFLMLFSSQVAAHAGEVHDGSSSGSFDWASSIISITMTFMIPLVFLVWMKKKQDTNQGSD